MPSACDRKYPEALVTPKPKPKPKRGQSVADKCRLFLQSALPFPINQNQAIDFMRTG
jgi:hypothetical protein